MNTQVLSKITGQPVNVLFAMVGNGKSVHYSPSNDETLCGKAISAYTTGDTDAPLCKRCAKSERVLSAEFTAWENENAMVEIQGDEPCNWTPDFSAHGASECYYGCGVTPVAVFVDYVGRTEGVCAAHRERIEGQTYELPTMDAQASQTDAESVDDTQEETSMTDATPTIAVVAVVQALPGMGGEQTHYHSAGCRDIEREMRKFGQTENDIFRMTIETAVDILEFEDGGRGSDHAEEYTPEWWNAVVENASYEVRFMSCIRGKIPGGVTTQGAPIKVNHSIYGIGEIPTPEKSQEETMRDAGAERFPVGSYVAVKADSVDRVGAYEGEVTSHGTMHYNGWHIPAAYVTSHEGTRKILVGDLEFATDPNEAGFVETEGPWIDPECGCERFANPSEVPCPDHTPKSVSNGYGAVAALSTGAGFHTVTDSVSATPETRVSTGTTHHTMDPEGKTWEQFEHVLSAGDVVKVVGMQGVYEVHCLIPGLPTVYVLGTQGEPFPVPATDVYAL